MAGEKWPGYFQMVQVSLISGSALSNTAATSHLELLKFKLIKQKQKVQFVLASTQVLTSLCGSWHCTEQCRLRTFPSSQKVPRDSTVLDSRKPQRLTWA